MNIPEALSITPGSPHYDRAAADKIDKVFVDGVHVPNCRAYNIPDGWAAGIINGVWQAKKYGAVTVKMK